MAPPRRAADRAASDARPRFPSTRPRTWAPTATAAPWRRNDAEIAARLRQLRQYGWDRRDHAEREGWNSRLDELQAAILTAKLPWLARENARRRAIADRYDAAFRDLPLRLLAVRPGNAVPARHLYPVFSDRRDALREHLASRGIETGIHYPFPLHLQPAYAFLGHRKGDFPVSEAACETELSLPMYPTLSDTPGRGRDLGRRASSSGGGA